MLMTEWNWDDALAYRYKEGHEDGLEKGREEGLKMGVDKGMADRTLDIARKMKAGGQPLDEISKYTGLSLETIEQL